MINSYKTIINNLVKISSFRYKIISVFILHFIASSCSENIKKKHFNSFLFQPCMIVNVEQDNTIEGEYLIAEEIQISDSTIKINTPNKFHLNNTNCKDWVLGWGTNKPYYDAGVENIRVIEKIDLQNKKIYLGKSLRGNGFPSIYQRIVFWNTKPSGFYNFYKTPIINPEIWSEFAGKSITFGSVEYDSLLKKWIMIVSECDTNKIQIYAAMSDNLVNWQAANDGKPILKADDFKNCNWAGKDETGKIPQSPFASDVVRYNNKWYLFLNGFSSDGKRQIGIAVSDNTLLGPYKINDNPVLLTGSKGAWNDRACYYPKIKKYLPAGRQGKDGFIMFYDGINSKAYERIGMAFSKDLVSWENNPGNPVIDEHTGWRSNVVCSEPYSIEIQNDSIFLIVAGVKKFQTGVWHHYITKRMYRDKSGNVDDTQLGIYLSTNGGKSFIAHKNNPVFVNDYTNKYENEHMGGNFKLIKTDTADFIFYQGKSSFEGLKYNILLRVKEKN